MTEQLAVKQTLCKHSTGQEIEIWQKLPVCCFQIMIYSSIPPPSLAHRWTNSLSLLEFLYSFPLEFYHPHTHTHTHTHLSIYLYTICTWTFVEAFLFVVVKTWRQLKHPSAGGLVNKFLSIYTTEYYSTIKRNELPIHT